MCVRETKQEQSASETTVSCCCVQLIQFHTVITVKSTYFATLRPPEMKKCPYNEAVKCMRKYVQCDYKDIHITTPYTVHHNTGQTHSQGDYRCNIFIKKTFSKNCERKPGSQF